MLASLIAYVRGEFCHSYVLAKMKLQTAGRLLWTRTIGSTIVGEGVDSLIFYPLAFYGSWETPLVLQVMLSNDLLKGRGAVKRNRVPGVRGPCESAGGATQERDKTQPTLLDLALRPLTETLPRAG